MAGTDFEEPVVVYLQHAEFPWKVLHSACDAIWAMTKGGFGGYATSTDLWATTFTLLTRAVLDPTPPNLGVARIAVEVLSSHEATRH